MPTKIFLKNTDPTQAVTGIVGNVLKKMELSQGSALVAYNTVTPNAGTVTPPTEVTQLGRYQGQAPVTWMSEPLTGFTCSGTVTFNLWALESATGVNVTITAELYRCDVNGKILSVIGAATLARTELTAASAANNWTVTPTSTTLVDGDRLAVRAFYDDAGGTTAVGQITLNIGAATAVSGDSYVQTNETVTVYTNTVQQKTQTGKAFVTGEGQIPPTGTATGYGRNQSGTAFIKDGWYNASWTYRKRLVIDNSSRGALTNFPVLVKLSSSRVTYANLLANGTDLRFVTPDGTVLDYEIASWNAAGNSFVWVKIPSLVANSTTGAIVYMYYGNTGAADGQNKTGVWSNSYVAVYHFSETASTYADSTSNALTSNTPTLSSRTGDIGFGNCPVFAGNTHFIDFADNAAFDLSSYTVECMYKPTGTGTAANTGTGGHPSDAWPIITKGMAEAESQAADVQFFLAQKATHLGVATDFENIVGGSDPSVNSPRTGTTSLVNNSTYHIAQVVSGSSFHKIYLNGVNDIANTGKEAISRNPSTGGTQKVAFGRAYTTAAAASGGITGSIDEVRISSVARSDDWMAANYASLQDSLVTYQTGETFQTTKTQTGVANIATGITTTQTQAGAAAILVTVARTQAGLANIAATTTRTQTGLASITNNVTTSKTQLGKALVVNKATLNDPVLWYQFNGAASGTVAYDDSGNGRDANILYGGTVAAGGKTENGLSLDGVDDFIKLPPEPFADYPKTSTPSTNLIGTFSFWFKTGTTGQQGLLCQYSGNGVIESVSWSYYAGGLYIGTDNKLYSTGFWRGNVTDAQVSAGSVTDGIWHNVVWRISASTSETFLDGVSLGVSSYDQVSYYETYQYSLGTAYLYSYPGTSGSAMRYYNGKIDDFRFYNRELTNGEISSLYYLPNATQFKTQTGKAAIQTSTVRTQAGLAKITATTDKTQTGVANVSNTVTTTKTQSGVAKILTVGSWWDATWLKRKKLTVDNSAQAETFTNFPVLVKLNNTRFTFADALSAGEDIRFTDNVGNPLSYEISKYDNVGEAATIWVKIPSIAASTSTDFYLYYNKAGATDAQNKNQVWSNGYVAVYHFAETTAGYSDSTSTGANSNTPTLASRTADIGLGNCPSFTGTTHFIDIPDNAAFDSASYTVEALVQSAGAGLTCTSGTGSGGHTNIYPIVAKGMADAESQAADVQFFLGQVATTNLLGTDFENIATGGTPSGNNPLSSSAAISVDGSGINHVAQVISGSSYHRQFVDGTQSATATISLNPSSGGTQKVGIGTAYKTDNTKSGWFNGKIAEVRISNVARTNPWMSATSKSTKDSSYISFGAAELNNTTKTQTGVAAIQVSTTKTQAAVAAVKNTTDRTQTGITAVKNTTTRTQTGVADLIVTGTSNRTQLGKAAVKNTTSSTQTGKAAVKLTVARTQDGKARIGLVTTKTQAGLAKVTATTTRTQVGVANIVAVRAAQISWVSFEVPAVVTVEATQTGKANIKVSTVRTQTGLAAVKKTVDRTQTGIGNIGSGTVRTQAGLAAVKVSTVRTQDGKARIGLVTTKTQAGLAAVTKTTTQVQSGIAVVKVSTVRTQAGLAAVKKTVDRTQTGKGNVKAPKTKTQDGKAKIQPLFPTNGLLAYWNFTGFTGTTATDVSGNGKVLTSASSGIYSTTGKIGTGSRVFDSSTAYAYTATGFQLDYGYTIHLWLKLELGAQGGILSNSTFGGTILRVDGLGQVSANHYDGAAWHTAGSSNTITYDVWQRIALVWDGIDSLKVIVDNTTTGITGVADYGSNVGDGADFRIHAESAAGSPYCSIDEVGVWNRALTTQELTNLYNVGDALVFGNPNVIQFRTQTGKAAIANVGTRTQDGKARIRQVTSRTQTGVSKITASTSRTQTGLADVKNTSVRTQDGKARIGLVTTKTQAGLAAVTKTTTQVQSGIAAVKVSTVRTQAGLAAVQVSTVRTQAGLADIKVSTVRTQNGKARIGLVTIQTQTGLAKVTATTLKTQAGVSSIVVTGTATKVQTGIASVKNTTSKTQLGLSAVKLTVDRTQDGKARIGLITSKAQSGIADVKKTTDSIQLGISRIGLVTSKIQSGIADVKNTSISTQDGKARIGLVTTKTQAGLADIKVSTTRTQAGLANLLVTGTTNRTQTGVAAVQVSTVKTQSGLSAVRVSTTRTQAGLANLLVTGTTNRTQLGIAAVKVSTVRTQPGLADIKVSTVRTQDGISRVGLGTVRTQDGISRIGLVTTKTQLGISRVGLVTTKTQEGISRVRASILQTQTGVTSIVVTGTATKVQTGKAAILKTVDKSQAGVAKIVVTSTTTRTQTGVAVVKLSVVRTQAGISRIKLLTLKAIIGVANIVGAILKTQLGVANIRNAVTRTQAGISRVKVATTKVQAGISRVTARALKLQLGKAAVLNTGSKLQTGAARITARVLKTQLGQAAIDSALVRTQLGIARITKSASKTQTGVAKVVVPGIAIIEQFGKAAVRQVVSRTQAGVSRIGYVTARVWVGRARIIANTLTLTKTGTSVIARTEQLTNSGTSFINAVTSKVIAGTAHILQLTSTVTKTGTSWIVRGDAQTFLSGTSAITSQPVITKTGTAQIYRQAGITLTKTGRALIIRKSHKPYTSGSSLVRLATRLIKGRYRLTKYTTSILLKFRTPDGEAELT